MTLELYACGFNAHGQLTGASVDEPPVDLTRFQHVLTASSIRILYAAWSETLLDVDGSLVLRGFSAPGTDGVVVSCPVPAEKIHQAFGDHTGLLGAVTERGELLTFSSKDKNLRLDHHSSATSESLRIAHLARVGNNKICISFTTTPTEILEFPDLSNLLSYTSSRGSSSPPISHALPSPLNVLTSGATSFTALLTDGSIHTWGDPRHNHLGRTISPSLPSSKPGLVDALGGIPIKKIRSGGWLTAAMARSDDLYVWGGRPGDEHRIRSLPGGADDEPVALVDIDEGVDVVDVAMGEGHVLALGGDGRVWAVGQGVNGQLGNGTRGFVKDWVGVNVGLPAGRRVEALDAGPWTSFLLIRKDPS
ncbi:MAG: hypothetical protein M1817_002630 [Caeruleum heppii]|nr:MAG: hypothetical protein M1817_002630 [Caeruleum heppii]